MRKIGMVGTGGIIRLACSKIERIEDAEVTAAWAHSENHGRVFEEDMHIPVFTDYEEFLHSDEVDTVYIGLPNQVHFEYMKKAVEAGKNVICEKPFTPNKAACEELIKAAEENHVFLFDATANRYYADMEELKRKLNDIGEIRMAEVNMSQLSSKYAAYRKGKVYPVFDPACGGGALYDLNSINVNLLVTLFGMPEDETYFANQGFNGVDTSGALVLDYNGFKAVSIASKDSDGPYYLHIQGTEGYIRMNENPGVLQNICLIRKGEQPVRIDREKVEDQRENMFRKIFEIIDQNDYQTAYQYMQKTLIVMEVLEKAGKKAGIPFIEGEGI